MNIGHIWSLIRPLWVGSILLNFFLEDNHLVSNRGHEVMSSPYLMDQVREKIKNRDPKNRDPLIIDFF